MKHAYLIMAHNNLKQLLLLLHLLDYRNNDIFLHVDTKTKDFDLDRISRSVSCAKISVFQRYDVKWADMSQTECQMFLLTKAVETYHDFYHLLSGQDLPIKSHQYIDDFFKAHQGVQFIHFDSLSMKPKESSKFFHIGSGEVENFFVRVQRKIGFDRHIPTGANWYSITHELASDICVHKEKALRAVKYTISSDECILQNYLKKISGKDYKLFKEQSDGEYDSNMRLIDWDRGNGRNPYTWRISDYEEIMRSDRLFARKFDEQIDNDIIERIAESVGKDGKESIGYSTGL